MSSNIFKTIYLILKYSLKRKLNRIGFHFRKKNKKNPSKSRLALGKKGMGALGVIFYLFGALYFLFICLIMIHLFMNQVNSLSLYHQLIKNNKIPSGFSSSSLNSYDSNFKENFNRYDLLMDQREKTQVWDATKKEFIELIDYQFYQSVSAFNVNIDDKFQEYYQTRIFPIEPLPQKSPASLSTSPYISIVYLICGFIPIFSLFTALSFSVKDLGVTDKYYEWLASNALPLESLYIFRVIENAFTNLVNWFFILPVLCYVYFVINGPWSIPIAIVIWFIWSSLIGAIQVLLELYLQHKAGLQKAKTFQSICHIIGTGILLLGSLFNSSMELKEKAFQICGHNLELFNWVPFFHLPFLTKNNFDSILSIIFQFALFAIVLYLVIVVSKSLTKDGLITNTTGFTGNRLKKEVNALSIKESKLHPVISFEKLMLFRNKQIFITVLLLPCILCVYYYYAFSLKTKTLIDPKNINITAFSLCTYVFLFTTFTLVQREGKGLWLIFTLPIEVGDYFFKKIWLWGAFSYFFFVIIYLAYFILGGEVTSGFFINFILVMIGIAIYAFISTSIGIIGYDPLSTNEAQRTSPAYTYLYLYLCGFYISALFSENLLVKLYILILAFTIALGLKSKVSSSLKYFFDKSIVFNQLTIFESILFIFFYSSILISIQTISFLISKNPNIFLSGLVSSGIMLIILFYCGRIFPEIKQMGIELIRFYRYKLFSVQLYSFVVLSLVVAIGYLYLMYRWNIFGVNDQKMVITMEYALFAIFLAPLIEEVLFRRILFRTLKEHFSVTIAILFSSLLFAIAHPPSSFVPVFVLGCLSAGLYQRSNQIHQSILLHTFYNAGIVIITYKFLGS